LTRAAPHIALYTWELAEVSRELGDRSTALQAYETVVKQDPSFKLAHRHIALLLSQEGRTQEALAKYDQALAIEPDDKELRKEARLAAKSAPQAAQARKDERMKAWKEWTPPGEKPMAFSGVTIRVGVFTGLSALRFRGNSDLQALTPSMALITTLPKGRDYLVLYVPASEAKDHREAWVLKDGKGKTRAAFNQRIWIKAVDPGAAVVLHAIPRIRATFREGGDRAYRGLIEISPRPGKGSRSSTGSSWRNISPGSCRRRCRPTGPWRL